MVTSKSDGVEERIPGQRENASFGSLCVCVWGGGGGGGREQP